MMLIASAFLVGGFYVVVSLGTSLRSVGDDITTASGTALTAGETDSLTLLDMILPVVLIVGAIGMMMAAMPGPRPHHSGA